MKRCTVIIASFLLLLLVTGCGHTQARVADELSVSELSQILEDMSPSGAALTHYYDGMEETVDASRASVRRVILKRCKAILGRNIDSRTNGTEAM